MQKLMCAPIFGIGIRHLQYVLLAWLIATDFWFQVLSFRIIFRNLEQYNRMENRKIWGNVVSKFIPNEQLQLKFGYFIFFSIGRILSTFQVLKISNKYFLLILCSIELVLLTICFSQSIQLRAYSASALTAIVASSRGFHWPIVMNLLTKWMPQTEITFANTIIVILREGLSFVFNYYIQRLDTITTGEWCLAVMGVYFTWVLVFLVVGAEGPDKCFLVSKEEFQYLSLHIGPRKRIYCKAKTPWKAIFKTSTYYFWALNDLGRETASLTINEGYGIGLGTYSFSMTKVYVVQSLMLIAYITILSAAFYVDRLVMKDKLTNNQIRKIFSSIGACGLCITMTLTAYTVEQSDHIAYFLMSTLFCCIMTIGQTPILFDLSPNYAAPTFSFFTSVRMVLLLGKFQLDVILQKSKAVETFIATFYRYGFFVFMTNLLFLMAGEIETQPFDNYDTIDWRKTSIASYP